MKKMICLVLTLMLAIVSVPNNALAIEEVIADEGVIIDGLAEENVAGEYADKLNSIGKSALYETVNIVPPRLRNSGEANGVTLTVNNNGTYTISGTCTADVRFDLWRNTTSIPSWLSYNEKYFAVLYGRVNTLVRLSMLSESNDKTILAENFDMLTPIEILSTGGFGISVNCSQGMTYNETVRIEIIKDTETIKGAYCGIKNEEKVKKIANLLPEMASTSVNGLTLTNNGDGFYTLTGTSTQDTNIAFFTSATNIPDWMNRTKEYYAVLQDAQSPYYRFIVTTNPGYEIIASTHGLLKTFTPPSSGGMMIAINVDGNESFNEKFTPIIVENDYFTELYLPKQEVVVSKDSSGDFKKIKDAIAYANQHRGTTIRILAGSYNLVEEYGKTYLDSLSDSNPDFGMYLGNDVKIICSPNADISFNYDGTNEWVVRNFSPFNTSNYLGYEVIGMRIIAHNCRYIVHDDPLWGTKGNFSHNVWRDCYFEIYSSPQVASWPNHQAVGGGFGTNTLIEFDSCFFNCHFSNVSRYQALSYHNDVTGSTSAKSRLTVKNCYFSTGNMLKVEGYGAATEKSDVVISGNSFGDISTDIVYNSSAADNMAIYQFNNQSR